MKLLIVESPGKVKKIQSFLGNDWKVAASVGHVRDLPSKALGVAPPDFKPLYEPTERGADVLAKLGKLAREADEIYLATDPDREGEAIAWHLEDALNLKGAKRVTYTEITESAVKSALEKTRSVDMNLVAAQEGRRVLDRLCGYMVSGPLSRSAGDKLSAGRVQSPAVRLVVDRERAIRAFKSTTHYGVELTFENVENITDGWKAQWIVKEWLQGDEEYLLDKSLAEKVVALRSLNVVDCKESESKTAPPAPFTTSSLQQAASNALKLKPKETMALAQKLYEGGHITYMRTDSPNLSAEAVEGIRQYAEEKGLPLVDKPRTWKSKEGAQEAHEAIRPTHIEVEDAGDTAAEKDLYKLIRLRTLASQLADAVFAVRTAHLTADVDGKAANFEAKGRTLVSPGWKSVMAEDMTEDAEPEPTNPVPALKSGSQVIALEGKLQTKKTSPPPRFKEASLIRELEKRGIGRPSTYAAIMETISSRAYVKEEKRNLVPTALGEKIVDGLVGNFSFSEYEFTCKMEDLLDKIAEGKADYRSTMAEAHSLLQEELANFIKKTSIACPECGEPLDHRKKTADKKDQRSWDFFSCRACESNFPNVDGKPGPKWEKKEVVFSEFSCETCGKPLIHHQGISQKTGKPYDFYGCSDKDCGVNFDNVDGKPVARKPRDVSEYKCKKCNKPLAFYEGTSKAGKPYKKFNCTGYPKCKQSYWVKDDGTPDYENLPK